MRFFKKAKQKEGQLAIAFHADGLVVASVSQLSDAKPVVELASFFPLADVTPEALEKIGKEVKAGALRCSTLLGGKDYQMLAVDAPNVPADELKTAVRWRLKDMLDFKVDEATIDVLDVPVSQYAAGRANGLFAVAARNSLIEKRQDLFAQAKVPLSVIDIPEMAQRNVSARLETPGRGLAMLSFDDDGGLLTVTFNGELYLSRRIDVRLAQLQEADAERRNASFDKITLELQRSLDHFDRQYNFINVVKLVLAPTGAQGLDEYLSSNFYTPVETLNLADVFELGKVPDLQEVSVQQRFYLTLGTALRVEPEAA